MNSHCTLRDDVGCEQCEVCDAEATHDEARENDYGGAETYTLCDTCDWVDAQSNAGERAYESSLSDFYGGSGPATLREQHLAAHAQKVAP